MPAPKLLRLKRKTIVSLNRGYRRVEPFLPWLSFAWGVASAFFVSRNMGNPAPFLLAGAGLVGLTLGAQKLLLWLNESIATESQGRKRKVKVAAKLGVTLLGQNAAQYILTFVLPFLFLSRHWPAVALTLPLALISLWDPWWFALHQNRIFLLIMRLWTTALIVGLLCTAVIPQGLLVFFPLLAVALFVTSDVWRLHRQPEACSDKKTLVAHVGCTTLALSACFYQWVQGASGPYPAVGAWIRGGAFTMGKPQFEDREKVVGALESVATGNAATAGNTLCCVTPLVASPSFLAQIRHTWFLNGNRIDDIALLSASGNGETAAFRTYSCKKNFPPLSKGDKLSCRVMARGSVFLGELSIEAEEKETGTSPQEGASLFF